MLVMLVIAAALIGRSVHTRASYEDQFDSQYIANLFHEDDMTPEFAEQLGSHDHTSDVRIRKEDKYGIPQSEAKTTGQPAAENPIKHVKARNVPEMIASGLLQKPNASDDNKRDVDIADREDHVTQYLSDQMVNTDNEITCLQASETEEDREASESSEVTEDKFFAFLTGLEKALEVDGVWSKPNDVDDYDNVQIQRIENPKVNEEYKE